MGHDCLSFEWSLFNEQKCTFTKCFLEKYMSVEVLFGFYCRRKWLLYAFVRYRSD